MPIQPMSAEEATMFLSRVYSDLSVADGFVGITGEEIMQKKAREALASHTAWLMEKIVVPCDDEVFYDKDGNEFKNPRITLLQEIENLTEGKE